MSTKCQGYKRKVWVSKLARQPHSQTEQPQTCKTFPIYNTLPEFCQPKHLWHFLATCAYEFLFFFFLTNLIRYLQDPGQWPDYHNQNKWKHACFWNIHQRFCSAVVCVFSDISLKMQTMQLMSLVYTCIITFEIDWRGNQGTKVSSISAFFTSCTAHSTDLERQKNHILIKITKKYTLLNGCHIVALCHGMTTKMPSVMLKT